MEVTFTFIRVFCWTVYLVLPLLMFLISVVIILGQWVGFIEKWSKFDGLYWSLITATTVGYGDIRPLKKVSKALSVIIAVIGMMLTGIIIALTLSSANLALEKHADQQIIEQMKARF